MTDGQSASLPWNEAPIWGLRPDFYYCQTVVGLLIWSALSDEGTGLALAIAAGPHQRSHSRVRIPWDSQTYFTVSDSRLPFLSPPTTRRATVEVFDPASTPNATSKLNPQLNFRGVDYRQDNFSARIPRKTISLLSRMRVYWPVT
jgi:hypothetical protein